MPYAAYVDGVKVGEGFTAHDALAQAMSHGYGRDRVILKQMGDGKLLST